MNPKFRKSTDLTVLESGILAGNRFKLGKAITLVESQRPADQLMADQLLERLMPHTGHSLRLGITGVPGVGKSTFIEQFGKRLIGQGKKVAVLAIDPSSSRTKGSIMGDKTRMELLSNEPNAFVRPTPTSESLGGVARKTRESMLLCEAAGFDVVIVETVGVGQSEVTVKEMVDCFLLLMLAGAGDELQGIKKGIMEMADIVAITKADGDNLKPAQLAKTAYENALHLFQPEKENWLPQVITCSALEETNLKETWELVDRYQLAIRQSGWLEQNRSRQALNWLRQSLKDDLEKAFFGSESVKEALADIVLKADKQEINPYALSRKLVDDFIRGKG